MGRKRKEIKRFYHDHRADLDHLEIDVHSRGYCEAILTLHDVIHRYANYPRKLGLVSL